MDLSKFLKFNSPRFHISVKDIFAALHVYAQGFTRFNAKFRGKTNTDDVDVRFGIYTLSWFTLFPRYIEELAEGRDKTDERGRGKRTNEKKDKANKLFTLNLKHIAEFEDLFHETPGSSSSNSHLAKAIKNKINSHIDYLRKLHEDVWGQDLKKFSHLELWVHDIPAVKQSELVFYYYGCSTKKGIKLPRFIGELEIGKCYLVKGNENPSTRISCRGIIYVRDNENIDGVFYDGENLKVKNNGKNKILKDIINVVDLRRVLYTESESKSVIEARFTKLKDILQKVRIVHKTPGKWELFALGIGRHMLPRIKTDPRINKDVAIIQILASVIWGRCPNSSVTQWWEVYENASYGWEEWKIYMSTHSVLNRYENGEYEVKSTPKQRPASSSQSGDHGRESTRSRPSSHVGLVKRQTSNTMTNRPASPRRGQQ